MERSRCTTKSRRLRYSASMAVTDSCGPRNASTEAFWAMELGFDVEWLWSLVMAVTMGAGTSPKPMRQPVMAYVLESDPATSTVSLEPGREAMENGSPSWSKRE